MKKRRSRRTADIDITPLIDVLFMLIIFFVLTASFVQGRIEVDLPSGEGTPMEEQSVTLSVQKDGTILWDGAPVAKDEIADLAKGAAGREIMIAGDKEAPYGVVAEVLDILRRAGAGSAGLLMQGGAAD
ncbi:biopolymer transporter ExbD [Synergistaceae bacterium OttesenSCG-928-D05]|nr:biopolymer transporter ExbD [Synergistaceae bacterium OttesenSCG-928-D05]